MKNFKELRIWQKGMDIAVNCFKIVKDFPNKKSLDLLSKLPNRVFQYLLILPKVAVAQVRKTIVGLLKYL